MSETRADDSRVSVSIVVSIYNVADYLPRCVDSLLNQSYPFFQLILVDDGSTDASSTICDAYAQRDSRIKVLHKPNGGLSDARNTGLASADGEFLWFVDGDDWVERHALSALLETATASLCDVAVCGFSVDFVDAAEQLIHSEQRVLPGSGTGLVDFNGLALSTHLVNMLGYAWNKLYRREFVSMSGVIFPKGISLVEDALFNGPLLSLTQKIAFVEAPLIHYVQRQRLTLGTSYYANFVDLRFSAIRAMGKPLLAWGYPNSAVEEIQNTLRREVIRFLIAGPTRSGRANWREASKELSRVLGDRHTQETAKRAVRDGAISGVERTLFLLIRLRAKSVLNLFHLAYAARRPK